MPDQNKILHGNEAEDSIIKNIEQHGWHVSLFHSNDYLPTFAYTIGLYENYQHPEIISFGLNTDLLGSILNEAGFSVKHGNPIQTQTLYEGYLEGYSVQFVEVLKENYHEYFGFGYWYYKNTYDFPALQLVWPDKQHKFPWEEGFNKDWLRFQKLFG